MRTRLLPLALLIAFADVPGSGAGPVRRTSGTGSPDVRPHRGGLRGAHRVGHPHPGGVRHAAHPLRDRERDPGDRRRAALDPRGVHPDLGCLWRLSRGLLPADGGSGAGGKPHSGGHRGRECPRDPAWSQRAEPDRHHVGRHRQPGLRREQLHRRLTGRQRQRQRNGGRHRGRPGAEPARGFLSPQRSSWPVSPGRNRGSTAAGTWRASPGRRAGISRRS